eukprot:45399-Prymnesium_polylepis.1
MSIVAEHAMNMRQAISALASCADTKRRHPVRSASGLTNSVASVDAAMAQHQRKLLKGALLEHLSLA